jgi:hypothetical protein
MTTTTGERDPLELLLLDEIRAGYSGLRKEGATPAEVTADVLRRRARLQEIRGQE